VGHGCAFVFRRTLVRRSTTTDLFSKDAAQKANTTMSKIKVKTVHRLLGENYPKVPDQMQGDLKEKRGGTVLRRGWIDERPAGRKMP